MPKNSGASDDFGRGAKAKAAKAESAAAKAADAARRKEAAEEAEWMDGADVKSMQRKAAAEVERKLKAERKKAAEEQLRKEEEEAAALKKKLRGAEKVAVRKALAVHEEAEDLTRLAAPALEARGIDAAIALTSIVAGTGGSGSPRPARAGAGAGAGADEDEDDAAAAAHASAQAEIDALAASAAGLAIRPEDRHPERRMKAAYKRFEERELPLLKEEFPTLRRSQLTDMLFRKWQRSPENPMNQASTPYNAPK